MSDWIIFKDNVKMMIDQFQFLEGIDVKESKFKEVLDYMVNFPEAVRRHRKFYRIILKTIRENQLRRHHYDTGENLFIEDVEHWELIGASPVINYNQYHYIYKNI